MIFRKDSGNDTKNSHQLDVFPMAAAIINKNAEISAANELFWELAGKKSGKLLEIIDQEIVNKITTSKGITEFEAIINKDISVKITSSKADNAFIVVFQNNSQLKLLESKVVMLQKTQAKGQLAGGIAHDFNNLLTAIIGFCDLLLMRHIPGEASFSDIMQIKQNAHRAANLVRQLLAFSRRQTLQPQVVNLTDTISELSHLLRRLIGENIELNLEHINDLWPTTVDIGQFEQVIVNLVVNARDAMPDGGAISIKTSNLSYNGDIFSGFIKSSEEDNMQSGDYICISIKDNGMGMDTQTITHIFEPFFTTKKTGEGTGLGLATVSGIVQQSGGHLFVKSGINYGTEFRIFLKRETQNAISNNKPSEESLEIKDLTGTETVLLVEDEDPVRIFTSRALTNKGYEVMSASNGEEAMVILKEKYKEIDIIITGVVMPGIKGTQIAAEARKLAPEIPVIFISGYGEDVFDESFGKNRNFHFLPKPYTLHQITEKVKDVLTGKAEEID